MPCLFYGINIDNDVKNKIANAIQNSVKGNSVNLAAAVTFFDEQNNKVFRDALFENLNKRDKPKFNSADELTNEAISSKVDQRTIEKTIREQLVNTLKTSTIQHSQRSNNTLDGFSSIAAKRQAREYTAHTIQQLYYSALFDKTNARMSDKMLKLALAKPQFAAYKALELIEMDFAEMIINRLDGDILQQIVMDGYSPTNRDISKRDAAKKVIDDYMATLPKNETKLHNFYNLYKKAISDAWAIRRNEAGSHYSTPWIDYSFNSPLINDIISKLSLKVEDKFFDYNEEEVEFEDEQTKEHDEGMNTGAWDKIRRSFDSNINIDLKLYLSNLYKTNQPYDGSMTDAPYASDNELGCKEYYDANYLIQQIVGGVIERNGFTGIEEFTNAIANMASTMPSLYGLGALVNRMKQDKTFAHKVFYELNQPKYRKQQIRITSENTETYVSNAESSPVQKVIYTLRSNLRSTFKDTTNINDAAALNKILYGTARTVEERRNILSKSLTNDNIKRSIEDYLLDLYNKYFPDLKQDVLLNYLHSNNNDVTHYEFLANAIVDAIQIGYNINKQIDEANKSAQRFNVGRELEERVKPDYSKVNYEAINGSQAIVLLAKELVKFNDNSIRLTSYNAERKMGSDLGDNNRISFITSQIEYIAKNIENGNEENANRGLEILADLISKCPQYKYSPIFFGIPGTNKQGLFRWENGKVVVNENAKDVIKFSLFDGIANQIDNTGVLYNDMTRGDYFMSMVQAYINPINIYEYNQYYSPKVLQASKGGYFLTVPSDMPKNSIMQYHKYNTTDLFIDGKVNTNNEMFLALRQMLLNELNTFMSTLYSDAISKEDNTHPMEGNIRVIKDSVDGLFEHYHHKKGALIKDSKLTGRVFTFESLFKTNGFDINEAMQEAFNIYGGLLTKQGNTLRINPSNWYTNGELDLNIVNPILNNIVSQWITNYQQETAIRSAEFANMMDENVNSEIVFSMALNYVTAHQVFADIIEGDRKFYKDTKTFIKRAKENQAGGKSYGSYRISDPLEGGIIELENNDILKSIGISTDRVIKERNGFVAVCIQNTVKSGRDEERITADIKRAVKDDSSAEKLIQKYTKDKHKMNDAQSYITFDEWIRRMYANGRLGEFKDLIQQILDAPEDSNSSTGYNISGIGLGTDAKIQVQKNYYFDLHYDEVLQLMYPRQIKNAEFVLIPQLLPKDSELRQLYDIMTRNGIDQINTSETSKAAQKTTLTFWKSDKTVNPNFEQDIEIYSAKEIFYYRSLYEQQRIPQHLVESQNKFGIQIAKKIVDNRSSASKEVNDAIDRYFEAYKLKIENSFNAFIREMGWKVKNDTIVNQDGSALSAGDFIKFREQGKKEAQRLGLDANFIDYYTTDETGQSIMPTFMNNVSKKLESVCQSMFNNNITRQKLPGFHVAIVSNMGYGRDLKYRVTDTKKDGTQVVYSEFLVPHYYKEVLKQKLNKEKGINAELLSDEELLNALKEAELDYMVMYYMPTENKGSILTLRVVGFLPSAYGSTGMLPEEAVVIEGGKDHDGDTIYTHVYQFASLYDKDGKFIGLHKYTFDPFEDVTPQYQDFKNTTGLNVSFDNWLEKCVTNTIIDSIITIMSDDTSLEENMTGSQFEDVVAAKNKWDSLREQYLDTSASSPADGNIFDQIQFRDNTMSGALLKAKSVQRDTLCSLSNVGQGVLNTGNTVQVIYTINNDEEVKTLENRFGKNNVERIGNRVIVTHNKFGWSTDNKNIDGSIITSYSSETTAHILDAVKEGAIYNENDFTFSVFKTLVDIGSNYDTAIGFLATPAITRLVRAWNENNSMFVKTNSTPVAQSVKQLFAEMGYKINNKPISDYTSYNAIVANFDTNQEILETIANIYGITTNSVFKGKYPLSSELFEKRIKNELTNDESKKSLYNFVFDLTSIVSFNDLSRTAKGIESIAQCTNPDKFGAKQTLHSTRLIVDKINKALDSLNKDSDNYGNYGVLLSKGKPFLASLYGEDSFYPHLAEIYKDATKASLEVNSQLFDLEKGDFPNILDTFVGMIGRTLTDEEYDTYKKYLVSSTYRFSRLLSMPITIDENGFIVMDTARAQQYMDEEDAATVDREEFYRIMGLKEREKLFKIKNLSNPTKEEIAKFNNLTPAQKVIFIKQNFVNNAELFNILNAETVNNYSERKNGYSINKISFIDNIYSNDELIFMFNEMFNHKNTLIRLATIDLIKYAFTVEGFNFKSGNTSKIVANDSLLNFSDDGVTSIISEIRDSLVLYSNPYTFATRTFYNNFVRSHPEILKGINLKSNDAIYGKLNSCKVDTHGLIHVPAVGFDEVYTMLGFDENKSPKYAKLLVKQGKQTYQTIYAIEKRDNDGIYLYPLNLLERNEYNDISYNPANNVYLMPDYYIHLIDKLSENKLTLEEYIAQNEENKKYIDQLATDNTITKTTAKKAKDLINNPNALQQRIEYGEDRTRRIYSTFVNKIVDAINDPNQELVFYPAYDVKEEFILQTPIHQKIKVGDETVDVIIKRKQFAKSSPQGRYILRTNSYNEGNTNVKFDDVHLERIPVEEMYALNDAIGNSNSWLNTFYEITVPTTKELEDYYNSLEKAQQETNKEASLSTTITPDTIAFNEDNGFSITENLAKIVIDDILRNNHNEAMSEHKSIFSYKLRDLEVKTYSLSSIKANKVSVYKSAVPYYEAASNYLVKNIKEFVADDGNVYNLGSKEFYEYLVNGTNNDYNRAVKLLLEGRTFGNIFGDLAQLDFTGEDAETVSYINDIKNYINRVKSLSEINNGYKNLFDIYFAQKYSNNPIVQAGIVKLSEAFGDITWWDNQFSDITELNQKEVQVIAKNVYSILTEASQIDAPKAVLRFREELRELTGTTPFDFNRIIDENGKFVQQYTDEFLIKKQELSDRCAEAYALGRTSRQYIYAKLAQDEFLAKNVHQKAAQEFYLKDTQLRREVLNNAEDLFFEYIRLNNQLYNESNYLGFNQEEADRRWRITQQIEQLRSIYNEDGSLKDDYTVSQVNALNKYITESANNKATYFKKQKFDEFSKLLEKNAEIVKKYEEKYPNKSFDALCRYEEYFNARKWLFENATYKLSDTIRKENEEAYGVLNKTQKFNDSVFAKLKRSKNRFNVLGVINGNLFTKKEVASIKEDILKQYGNLEDDRADATLIKDIERTNEVYTKEFYDLFDSASDESTINEKRKIFTQINDLLSVGLDENGQINVEKLLGPDGIGKEGIIQLGNLYMKLNKFKGSMSKEDYKAMSKEVDFKINADKAKQYQKYYEEHLKDEISIIDWNRFIKSGYYSNNGTYIIENRFNSLLFGYAVPKNKTKYLDKEKTRAKSILSKNFVTTETQYYKEAAKKHKNDATWYAENHYYNPYSRKYEPLPIWTNRVINPDIENAYSYEPAGDNGYTEVIEDKIDTKFDASGKSNNYNSSTGQYNNEKYTNLTNTEKEVLSFLQRTVNAYNLGRASDRFIREGFAPRRYKAKKDVKWYVETSAKLMGLSFGNTRNDPFNEDFDYTHDTPADFRMLTTLRTKGYVNPDPMPKKKGLTDEQYEIILEAWKKRNAEIEKNNRALEKDYLDRNWALVFEDFINNAVNYEATEKVKNTVFTLLEELKRQSAYKLNFLGNVKHSSHSTVESDNAELIGQQRAYELVQNWARRVLLSQYKEESKAKKWANLLQNMTSAKYMILNLTGGITNVGTGLVNIHGETWANYYFSREDFLKGEGEWANCLIKTIAENDSLISTNLHTALIKLYNIVEYTTRKEQRDLKDLEGASEKINDSLYILQSSGEHYMQNSVMFAMLKSHRLYEKHEGQGDWTIGSFSDYTQNIEQIAMQRAIDELVTITSDEGEVLNLKEEYEAYINEIKSDINYRKVFDRFKEDINISFVMRLGTNTALVDKYDSIRKQLMKDAQDKFDKLETVESQYELRDGLAQIKEGSNLTNEMFADLRGKIISVNKKIHGVYDKLGAAQLEKKWYGSLVMQYHKHIYPGFMKRFRGMFGGGMYNESRNSIERGSYVSLARFLTMDLRNIQIKDDDGSWDIVKATQTIFRAAIDNATNLVNGNNWKLLPNWEKQNIRRCLGDAIGALSSIVMAILIYAFHDDDDIKDSDYLSTLLYLADRLHTEAMMYTPWGAISEARTIYSSPVATTNCLKDIWETCQMTWQWMVDPNFDIIYKKGIYKDENKLKVKVRRNIPAVRVYDRLSHMANNNKYYRIGDTNLNIKTAKNIANWIAPDK